MRGKRILWALVLVAAAASTALAQVGPSTTPPPTPGSSPAPQQADDKKPPASQQTDDKKPPTPQPIDDKKPPASQQTDDKKPPTPQPTDDKKQQPDDKKKTGSETDAVTALRQSYLGGFQLEVLAGGSINDFRIRKPSAQISSIKPEMDWVPMGDAWSAKFCEPAKKDDIEITSIAPDRADVGKTTVGIRIGNRPCWWPPTQMAKIKITAQTSDGAMVLFDGQLPVSLLWFPLTVTLAVVALIYPGAAAAAWYVGQRRRRKALQTAKRGEKVAEAPSFWVALDPVELTKNPYGRGSIAKLQIFLFSYIVFGLLLFHVMRTGLLAAMSPDILYLMGISSLGAAGGKLAYTQRRRLSLDNWVWLTRKGWLPPEGDKTERARWSELFVDADTKEFDPYRFQMAIFSIVVAIALIKTSAMSLEAFKMPQELLALLGLSQVVFVGGQALEGGGYKELDAKLDAIRQHEARYQELKTKSDAAVARGEIQPPRPLKEGEQPPVEPPKPEDAETERKAFKTAVSQAATMFWAIYGQQLGKMPDALRDVSRIEPEMH